MVAGPTFTTRSGMRASFLEIETVGLGSSADLLCDRGTTVHENGLPARELSVDPPVVRFIVCPCDQLPQAIAIGYEIDRRPIEPRCGLLPGGGGLDSFD